MKDAVAWFSTVARLRNDLGEGRRTEASAHDDETSSIRGTYTATGGATTNFFHQAEFTLCVCWLSADSLALQRRCMNDQSVGFPGQIAVGVSLVPTPIHGGYRVEAGSRP